MAELSMRYNLVTDSQKSAVPAIRDLQTKYLNYFSHLGFDVLHKGVKEKLFYGPRLNELKRQWNNVFDYKNLEAIAAKAAGEKENLLEAINSATDELATT
ncbi:hypothetical protein TYRP_022714 [Tyrophagus putrescentiae]|nr:hypothetical protein TYRP_022714 [Tyrophagus putrescentiae]